MSQAAYLVLMAAIAVIALAGMWFGWRGRGKRHASVIASDTHTTLRGDLVAQFERASYVSTTPAGAPFERVLVSGLRFKGYAEVTVRTDGVAIEVTGEQPVLLSLGQLRGTDTAGGRIGKAVEQGGLSLLRWVPAVSAEPIELESSFRFSNPTDQRRFADAIDTILTSETSVSEVPKTINSTPTTQEDA